MPDVASWIGRVLLPVVFAPIRVAATWTESLADAVASRLSWSPLDKQVSVIIDDTDDDSLLEVQLHGVVRACSSRANVWPHELLIELSQEIAYNGRFSNGEVWWLVAAPCLRWHRINRLPVSWSAVRLIAAPSFRDATRNRTIGTGRVQLT